MTESQDAAATCVGVLLQAAAAEVGAGVLRRVVHRGLDRGVVEQPLDPAEADQLVVEPLLGPDVGVLVVDQLELGVVPAEPVAVAVVLEELAASRPSRARSAHSIGSRSSRSSTDSQRASTSSGLRVGVGAEPVLDVLLGEVEVLQLQLDGGQRAAVGERDQVLERRVVRDRAQRRRPRRRR